MAPGSPAGERSPGPQGQGPGQTPSCPLRGEPLWGVGRAPQPLLSLRDPAEGGARRCPACAVRLWEGCRLDGDPACVCGSPSSERCPALPFAELQEVLPPPRALRQQVRAVHPQVHQLQPRGCRRLPAEAPERTTVSASPSAPSRPGPPWWGSALRAPKAVAPGPRMLGLRQAALSWLPPPRPPESPTPMLLRHSLVPPAPVWPSGRPCRPLVAPRVALSWTLSPPSCPPCGPQADLVRTPVWPSGRPCPPPPCGPQADLVAPLSTHMWPSRRPCPPLRVAFRETLLPFAPCV